MEKVKNKVNRLFLFFIFLLLLGCATDESMLVKGSVRVKRIDEIINGLEKAYNKRDINTFFSFFSSDYDDYDRLKDIFKALEIYDEIRLELFVDRILINREKISVSIYWEKKLVTAKERHIDRKSGNSLLELRVINDGEIKVKRIKGEYPFGLI
ncbi:MAG: hypothetical protein ACE5EA_00935 [Nitrospirota bacterium]